MKVILGVLSIFQLVFIPGLFVVYFLKMRNFWINLLIVLSMSPIINFFIVFLLAAVHLYTQTTMLILFTIECLLLLILYFPYLSGSLVDINPFAEVKNFFRGYFSENNFQSGWRKSLVNVFLVGVFGLAVYCLFYYVNLYMLSKPEIFYSWDPVFSWNRWAVDWSNNKLAGFTHHYPQLLPANWSITYVFMNDARLEFFARHFMRFIEVYVLLAIFIAGVLTKKVGYFWGVAITAWVQFRIGVIGSGYADTAVSFWGLLPYLFIIFAKLDQKNWKKYVFVGAVLAAGAMITKQVGGWIVLTYIIMLFLVFWKDKGNELGSLIWKIGLIYILMIIPWYLYAEYDIRYGTNTNELAIVITIGSEGLTWFGTLKSSLSFLFSNINIGRIPGYIPFLFLVFISGFSYKEKFWRWVNVLVIIPFFYLWIFYAGYDTRNLNLVVPFFGISVGMGLQTLGQYRLSVDIQNAIDSFFVSIFKHIWKGISWVFVHIKFYYFLPLLLLIFLLPQKYSDTYLIEKSINMHKILGNSQINGYLYDYFEVHDNEGKIVTSYRWLEKLPMLKDYHVSGNPANNYFIDQITDDEVGYVLVEPKRMSEEVSTYFNTQIDEGKIQFVFEEYGFVFYEICHDYCEKSLSE